MPGADERAHAAAARCGADVMILELEDFTPPPLRPKARDAVHGTVTLFDTDQMVWGDDGGCGLYIHRLASSRHGAGAILIQWARVVAAWRCKRWLRLETWQENRALRDYYERQGFRHVRDAVFAPDSPLPADYRGTRKSLYQIEL